MKRSRERKDDDKKEQKEREREIKVKKRGNVSETKRAKEMKEEMIKEEIMTLIKEDEKIRK